jgi:lactoylglutathione lyase
MARVVHLAMKVDDIDKASAFLCNVFGFKQITVPGLRSTVRYVTDGTVHVAINQLGGRKEQPDEKDGAPCIDHFGLEVEDFAEYTSELSRHGCETVSQPGRPLRVRTPGGLCLEIIPKGGKPGIE